jgi:hypothetical protein
MQMAHFFGAGAGFSAAKGSQSAAIDRPAPEMKDKAERKHE